VTDSKPSKSARKRKQLALQELGEQLIELNATELASLSLDDRLEKAIRDAGQIKSRGALRRQKQLIGKLMRDVDPEPIRGELAKLRADDVRTKRLFSRAERWRDRIVNDGMTALNEFEIETGETDAELRTLLGELDVAFSERAEKTIRRQIFRRVHEILVRII
jgi:ribosome-associated protein